VQGRTSRRGEEQNQVPLDRDMEGEDQRARGVGPWWRLAGGRTSAPGGTSSLAAFRAKDGAPGSNGERTEVWRRSPQTAAARKGWSGARGRELRCWDQEGPWSVTPCRTERGKERRPGKGRRPQIARSCYRATRRELTWSNCKICVLFVWLISHQPAVLFSQNKSAISNQPTVLFSQKPAPDISHQPTEQVPED
jgi:hypothetical protein